MRDRLLKVVASLMIVAFPLSLAAADLNAAMLQASGLVILNGVHAPRSAAVFSGDKIQTYPDSAVSLTLKGTSVLLLPESVAVYRPGAIDLGAGTAVVTTEQGMSARVEKITVSPAGKSATKFQVTRAQGRILIAALRGPVAVFDGASSKTVNEGSTATVADPAAPTPPPAPPAGGFPPGLAVAVGVAAAAAAGGIAVAVANAPSSPGGP